MLESEKHESYSGDETPGDSLPAERPYSNESASGESERETPPHNDDAIGEGAVSIAGSVNDTWIITGHQASVSINYEREGLHPLSEFEVKESEKDELRSSFIFPVNYDEVAQQVVARSLIWIVGLPEAGKGTLALQLALTRLRFQSTYKIQGARAWSIISKSDVENSVIVLIDAVYLANPAGEIETAPADFEALDEPEIESEELDLAAEVSASATVSDASSASDDEVEAEDAETEDPARLLKGLQDRGNTVIITSTEEVYEQGRGTRHLLASAAAAVLRFKLSSDSYGRVQRLELIKKAVNLAHNKWLSVEVKQSALRACDELARKEAEADSHPILKDWLPGEICSFVTSVLVNAKSADEVEAELKVPLDWRVHSWFMQLNDESTRVFVLTRTIFPSLEESNLNDKLGEIVNRLKKTYSLALVPLGVCAYRAAPYISDRSPYRFVNAHVLRAASDVVAQFYHRPFAELSELLRAWSVPAELNPTLTGEGASGSENKRKQDQLIRDSAPVRDAIARMAGRVGRYNLASVKDLLDYWAGHRFGRIGQAAGIALRHTVANEGNYEEGFALIESWAKRSTSEVGNFRKRSAADALWRLVAAGLPPARREQVLRVLEYLARDSNSYVRRTVAYAVAQVLEAYDLARIRKLLEALANDNRDDVRTYFALHIAYAMRRRNEFRPLIKEWAGSEDEHLAEVAALCLLCNWGRGDDKALLHQIMVERPALFERTMNTAARVVVRRRGGSLTWPVLRHILNELASSGEDSANKQAITALINIRRWAAASGTLDAEALVKGLLKKWDKSGNASLRLVACASYFAAGRSAEERFAFLKDRLGSIVSAEAEARPELVAKGLAWMAEQDRAVIHELLQHWLINGDDNAIAVVVFYWLLAPGESEPRRYQHLTSILCNFPQPFERAMQQAIESLPFSVLNPALQSLASDERLLVREQVALTLGRMSAQDGPRMYRLLEDWLVLDEEKAGAVVVLFWVAAGDYTPEQRYESLKAILRSFPHAFDCGIRDAVAAWGAGCLKSLGEDLRQSAFPLIPGGGV
jgi:3-methyladenine DNA glycosylase AlkC